MKNTIFIGAVLVCIVYFTYTGKALINISYIKMLNSKSSSDVLLMPNSGKVNQENLFQAHQYFLNDDYRIRPDLPFNTDPLVKYFYALGDKKHKDFELALVTLEQLQDAYPASSLIKEQILDTLLSAAIYNLYEQKGEVGLNFLSRAENLGANDEFAFYSVALALQKAGALELANKYFEKASYYKLSPRFLDFFYKHLPILIDYQTVSEEYIQNLHSFLMWRNMAAEAEWLEELAGANLQLQEQIDPIQPVIQPDKGLAELVGIAVSDISLGPNIINNGGFEKTRSDSLPEFWSWAAGIGNPFQSALFVGGPDTLSPFSGETALRISGLWSEKEPDKLPARAGFESYPLTINPNTKYLLSLYYKTENISEGTPAILLDIFQGRRLGDYFMLPSTDGEWKLFFVFGETSDKCCSSSKIFLSNFATGTVWFDEVSLRELIYLEEPGKPIELPFSVVH
jgi:hypothetical protein